MRRVQAARETVPWGGTRTVMPEKRPQPKPPMMERPKNPAKGKKDIDIDDAQIEEPNDDVFRKKPADEDATGK